MRSGSEPTIYWFMQKKPLSLYTRCKGDTDIRHIKLQQK